MNLALFTKAIIDRIAADTGWTGGVVTTYFGSSTLAFPYTVLEVTAEADDAFDQDALVMTVRFHIFDLNTAGFSVAASAIERLRGDAVAQATRIPTFGFHRYRLVLTQAASGMKWAGGVCQYLRSDTAHDEDVYHFIETYQVRQTASVTET